MISIKFCSKCRENCVLNEMSIIDDTYYLCDECGYKINIEDLEKEEIEYE